MAISTGRRFEVGAEPESDDEVLARYRDALLRTGACAEEDPIHRAGDMRTCVHCGAHVAFIPVLGAEGWTICSACGEDA